MATITPINLQQGAIGQLKGPFEANDIINFGLNKIIKISITIGQKDLMPLNLSNFEGFDIDDKTYLNNKMAPLFYIKINNIDFYIKQNGTYESDTGIALQTVAFPNGAPASTTIDYVVLDI